ncbi:unnamed protein product [Polarella glacialis]|uniref:Uncharacterized protein n=1 Tax=Polarella glacialis TaxID=89957 RepID=A0A813JW44_POLGL|nr:unnamed protein product [Polarella glacialis]
MAAHRLLSLVLSIVLAAGCETALEENILLQLGSLRPVFSTASPLYLAEIQKSEDNQFDAIATGSDAEEERFEDQLLSTGQQPHPRGLLHGRWPHPRDYGWPHPGAFAHGRWPHPVKNNYKKTTTSTTLIQHPAEEADDENDNIYRDEDSDDESLGTYDDDDDDDNAYGDEDSDDETLGTYDDDDDDDNAYGDEDSDDEELAGQEQDS